MRFPSEHESLKSTNRGTSEYAEVILELYSDDTSSLSREDMRQYMAREDIQAWISDVEEADGSHTLDRIESAGAPPPIVREIWARAYPLLVTYRPEGYTTWEVLLYTLQYYDVERGHLSTALSSGPARSLRADDARVASIRSCIVQLANRGVQNPSASQVIEEYEERYATRVSRSLVRRLVTGTYYGESLDRPAGRQDGDEVTLYDAIPAEDTDAETMADVAYEYAVQTGHEQTWAIILDEIYTYWQQDEKS